MNRTGILAAFVVTTFAAATVTACGGTTTDVGATGSTDQALKSKKDGSPSGTGTTCSWDGVDVTVSSDGPTPAGVTATYAVGDTFKSPDGCNDCSCSPQGIMCTLRACAPGTSGSSPGSPGTGVDPYPGTPGGSAPGDPGTGGATNPSGSCSYHGHTWKVGAKVPSLDNCNNFGCTSSGLVQTEMACSYTCPTEKVIDCMPIVPENRLAKCYGPYHDFIAKSCKGVVFAL